MSRWTGTAAAVDEYAARLDAALSAGHHAASLYSEYDALDAVHLRQMVAPPQIDMSFSHEANVTIPGTSVNKAF
jgi:hypothetical protein